MGRDRDKEEHSSAAVVLDPTKILSPLDKEIEEAMARAQALHMNHENIKALEITESMRWVYGKNVRSEQLQLLQGNILHEISSYTDNVDEKSTYLLSSIELFRKCARSSPDSLLTFHSYAHALFGMGEALASNAYYEKAVRKAKQGLSIESSVESLLLSSSESQELKACEKQLEDLIKFMEAKMNFDAKKTVFDFKIQVNENEPSSRLPRKAKKQADAKTSETSVAKRLRSFWAGMDVKSKRKFFIVDIKELKCSAEKKYGSSAREALERSEGFAKTRKKWKLWKCGTCLQEFVRSAECKKHIEQKHMEKYRPPKDLIPHRVDDYWGVMISSGDWEPVDVKAAVEMMKDRLAREKKIVYVNGWSKEWPLAKDKDRRYILKEFHEILKSLFEHKILSCSIRDWLIEFALEDLEVRGVSEHHIKYFGLVNTLQCLCFLGLGTLEQVQFSLGILSENVCPDFIHKAVDNLCENYRVKERIYSDNQFSCLLLDRRLLKGNIDAFDEDGIVEVCSPGKHYAGVSPQGDEIVSWLLNCSPINEEIFNHRAITRNLGIWLAVLRIIESSCEKLETKYKRKVNVQAYSNELFEAEELCDSEEEKRVNVPVDQWTSYASVLHEKCQERVTSDEGVSNDTLFFLSVVRDALEGAKSPRFDVLQVEAYLNCISGLSNVGDNSIADTLAMLKLLVNEKLQLIDLKILLHENLRSQLLDGLTELSMFDHRSVILPLMKWFLRNKLETMMDKDAEDRSVAAEKALLLAIELEEQKKSQLREKEKENCKSRRKEEENKEGSTESSSVDQNIEVDHPMVSHEYDPSDVSGNVPELMKTEEELEEQKMSQLLVKEQENCKSFRKEEENKEASADASDVSGNVPELMKTEEELEEKKMSQFLEKEQENCKSCRKEEENKEASAGSNSVDQKTEVDPSVSHENDPLDESGNVPEVMKTEEEQQLENVGREDKANMIEDPCPDDEPSNTSDQLKSSFNADIQTQTVTAEPEMLTVPESALVENEGVFATCPVSHEYYPSDESGNVPEVMKTEEEQQIEHVSAEDKETITEGPCPDHESSSTIEQLKNSSNPDIQMETVTAEPEGTHIVYQSASPPHHIQLNETDSSTQLISAPEEDDITYDSALDMILKSLWHLSVFKKELPLCRSPAFNNTQESDRGIVSALRSLLSLFDEQPIEHATDEKLYHFFLGNLRVALKVTHPMANNAAKLLVAIFEFLHCWESPYRESLVTSLFTLEEIERMKCNRCQREPNYPEQRSYGLVVRANLLREIKSEFGNVTFENALKVIRVNVKMLCDPVRGGCGNRNYFHHFLIRLPSIFTIVLEWENNETEEEISDTTTVLDTEIDIGVLYEGVNPSVKYRLVSVVGSGEKEHNCIAYENKRWVIYARSLKQDIGDWERVPKFCSEWKVRPEILFFEATW